jgi:integrase
MSDYHVSSLNPPIPQSPKLLDQMRDTLRLKHYSKRTEEAYLDWVKRFIYFHNKRHPKEMGIPEIEQFLTYLAVTQHVAASTQNQALSALLFLYKQVLGIELGPINAKRAKKPERLPVVFSQQEVKAIMAHLDGVYWIMAQLLYGSGLRLMECLRLRVKDVDVDYHQILAYALDRKYPNAAKEVGWQYVFPSYHTNQKNEKLEGYEKYTCFLPTPNPSQEGNVLPSKERVFPFWEGLGVGKNPNFMKQMDGTEFCLNRFSNGWNKSFVALISVSAYTFIKSS